LLKGQITIKKFAKDAIDRLTQGIIDSFIDGLSRGLAGNILEKFLKETIFGLEQDLGETIGKILTGKSDKKDIPKTPEDKQMYAADIQMKAAVMQLKAAGGDVFSEREIPDIFGDDETDVVDKTTETVENNTKETTSIFGQIGKAITDAIKELGKLLTDGLQSLSSIFRNLFSFNSSSSSSSGFLSDLFNLFKGSTSSTDIIGSSISYSNWVDAIDRENLLDFAGFWADGGLISGQGTGTSDSILARVSNGEFIVNASQAAKFLPLLEAINNNRLPKFADGGLVGGFNADTVDLKNDRMSFTTNTQGVQQVFNINITGDISRQTRAEIQKMIPQIAVGVNMHNREIGIRGRR
jgi:hypothetical protein